MTGTTKTQSRDVAGACSEVEWKTRVELAALYRVLDLYGMSDLANQEVDARVEQQPDCMLMVPSTTKLRLQALSRLMHRVRRLTLTHPG